MAGSAVGMAGEVTGVMQLFSLVWMELVMAALAAAMYMVVSGKVIPAQGFRKAKNPGHRNPRVASPHNAGSKPCVEVGSSARPRSIHRTRSGGSSIMDVDDMADVRNPGKNSSTKLQSDGSCSDSDRSTVCPSTRASQRSPTFSDGALDVTSQARAIRLCGKSGNLAGAIGVYERVKRSGHGANSCVFNSLLDACIECGALERAEEYFNGAKSRNFITVVTYNTMMKGYLAQKKVSHAEALLRELAARGMAATQASYNGLIQSKLQGGDKVGAWRLVGEMQNQRLSPNSVTCAILLKGVMPAPHEVLRVFQLVQSMATPIDEVLFPLLVEACLGMDRLDILKSMHGAYTKQDGPRSISVASYGTMIKAYGKAHDEGTVLALWDEMKAQKIKLTSITVGCVVEALVANRSADRAWELIQEMWNNQEQRGLLNTVIYSTIIKGYVCARQPEKVMGLYEEMRSRSIQPNAITYNTILNAFAQCKAMDRAPRLLQEMYDADPRVEPDIITYSTIVKGYCVAGELDKALDLLKVMKSDAKLKPDEVTYNSLLDGCAKQNRLESALELVSDMKEGGVPVSNFTLSILVKLLGRCRRLDQAFETVNMLSKEYGFQVNLQVYTCLIQACFNNKQPCKALALHERMLNENLSLDEKAYTAILRGCMQFGLLDNAEHIVKCAYGIADGSVGSPGVDRRCLEELLSALGPNTKAGSSLAADIRAAARRQTMRNEPGPSRRFEPRGQASGRNHGRRQ